MFKHTHSQLKTVDAMQGEESSASTIVSTAPLEVSREILLVEDYAPNIMVATMMLEDLGYTVISAESGQQGLDILYARSAPFIAVLMDVQMYGMDGLQTTQRIRAMEQEKGFVQHIIGVTAHALAGDRERCLAAGMNDYVSKPIHPDILANKLQILG